MSDILSSSNLDPNRHSSIIKRLADAVNGAGINDAKPFTRTITAPASSQGNWNDISTAFVGDFSKCNLPISYTISGVTTAGQPASGYRHNPELSALAAYLKNTSGWNQQTAGNDGRTSVSLMRLKVDNYGQGDATCLSLSAYAQGAKASATSFLANPAAVLLNGGTFAGQNGVYLNPIEINCTDQGFDCAGVNFVANQYRTNNTGALGVYWNGYRSQSKGSVAIDSHFFGSGLAQHGIDFSTTDITGSVFLLNAADRPTVTGSRGGNAALASLLTGLAALGLITDSTTA